MIDQDELAVEAFLARKREQRRAKVIAQVASARASAARRAMAAPIFKPTSAERFFGGFDARIRRELHAAV